MRNIFAGSHFVHQWSCSSLVVQAPMLNYNIMQLVQLDTRRSEAKIHDHAWREILSRLPSVQICPLSHSRILIGWALNTVSTVKHSYITAKSTLDMEFWSRNAGGEYICADQTNVYFWPTFVSDLQLRPLLLLYLHCMTRYLYKVHIPNNHRLETGTLTIFAHWSHTWYDTNVVLHR
jgi:hypothetical protein